MPRSRVVLPQTTRITLSEDDFVDVVMELNAGEYVAMLREMGDRKPFSKILHYLIGWSFIDQDGAPIPYSLKIDEDTRRASIANLDVPTLRELTKAIDKHEQTVEDAHDKKKVIRASAAES